MKTKSRPQHTTVIDRREKKVIVTVVWHLIPPNILCNAPFSIFRIAAGNRFQVCSLSFYQEIGKKAIEDLEKNQASIEC